MKHSKSKSSRRAFLGTALAGISLASIPVVKAAGASNMRTVGVDGTHADLQSAMISITDNSISNGYLIKLLPGIHTLPINGLLLKPYVHIEGCGQGISEIACSGFSVLTVSTDCKLSNLSLTGNFTSPNAANAVIQNPPGQEIIFRMESVDIYVTGGYKAAVVMRGPLHTCFFDSVSIYTTSIGLQLSGHSYINGLKLFLSGNATNTPYWGIYVPTYSRIYLWGSKIGTGYGRTNRPGFGARLEVTNDALADVIGVYIPANNTNTIGTRVECYGLNSYARNDLASNLSVRLNSIRAEAGRIRLYGGLQQAESPANLNIRKSLFQSGSGIIETFADRFSSSSGNIWGTNTTGTSNTTTADNNLQFDDDHGGIILCDASAGSYSLRLPFLGAQAKNGIRFIFVKRDNSPNTIMISANGMNISGAPSMVLAEQYQKAEVVATATEWIIL